MTTTGADSIAAANIEAVIKADNPHIDFGMAYTDGNWPDFAAIAAEAGIPIYGLDVLGKPAKATGVDIEPGDLTVASGAAVLAVEKAAGVDRPIGYTMESWAQALCVAAGQHGLSASETAAGRTDWRLVTAHYGRGPHICAPYTCGCLVEANATQWIDHGPWDQTLADDAFLSAASHPGPGVVHRPTTPPVAVHAPDGNPFTLLATDGVIGRITASALQWTLNHTGGHCPIDGQLYTAATVTALQLRLNYTDGPVAADGRLGSVTIEALQRHVGARPDGAWGPLTTKALQATLNRGKF